MWASIRRPPGRRRCLSRTAPGTEMIRDINNTSVQIFRERGIPFPSTARVNGTISTLVTRIVTQVKRVFERVESEQGRLDLLVNNAFCLGPGPHLGTKFWKQGVSHWSPTFVGLVLESRLFSRSMKGKLRSPTTFSTIKTRYIDCCGQFHGCCFLNLVACYR